jgi:ABC-type nitrate/sulfonate/bicarbonate transport system substrate-binding protein
MATSLGSAIPGQAQQQQQQLLPLRINPIARVTILRILNWVALDEGIYKKNGLDVDQCLASDDTDDGMSVGGGLSVANELKTITGSEHVPLAYRCKPGRPPAPITVGGGMPVAFMSQFLVDKPAKRRKIIIATVQDRTNYVLIARKDITQPEQLRGKRIATRGDFNIMGFQALLFTNAMGWKPGRDFTFVFDASGSIDGLLKDKFDAYLCGEGLPAWQAAEMGYKPLIDFKQWKIPMTSSSFDADETWLKNNPETARRFVKSMVDAIAAIKNDKQTAFRAWRKYYGITDPKLLEFLYNASSDEDMPRKPYPSVEGLRVAKALYAGHPGLRDEEFRNARVEDFVDDSFVRALDQSGYIDSLYKKSKKGSR